MGEEEAKEKTSVNKQKYFPAQVPISVLLFYSFFYKSVERNIRVFLYLLKTAESSTDNFLTLKSSTPHLKKLSV